MRDRDSCCTINFILLQLNHLTNLVIANSGKQFCTQTIFALAGVGNGDAVVARQLQTAKSHDR